MIWDIGIEAGEGDSNITCDFDYINVTISSIGSKRFCGYVNLLLAALCRVKSSFVVSEPILQSQICEEPR